MLRLKPVAVCISAFIYGYITLSTALADDTEIYVPRDLPADQQVRPNILFILDSSGSMRSTVTGTNKSRNTVMKEVVNNLIDDLKAKEDVNIGLMRYKGRRTNCPSDNSDCENEQGGHVISPVQRLTTTNAASMKTIVNSIGLDDWTPLSETYHEAYLYMTGQTPVWGGGRSVASSMTGGRYISPISHACQKSHIIYVTDGEPTRDVDSNAAIRTLAASNTTYRNTTCPTSGTNRDGKCLPHLAEYMANQDLFPAPAPFADPTNRKQTITSHFVGFAIDLPLLKDAAQAGGGRYYTADNVSGLTEALKSIIVDITAENTSFAAPSVAVSAFSNLGFRNDLYYALFRPSEGANWAGNVKRYKLGRDNAGNPLIVDQNGDPAIDDSTGFFSNSASSFWSSITDGNDVAKGGVAGRLINPNSRNIFTWTDADRTATASDGVAGSVSLVNDRYRLLTSNSLLTRTMLGASNDIQKNQFVEWARGKNTDGTNRLAIADVLHNEPKLIAYVSDEDLVRVSNAPLTSPEQLYMFFGSNEGFIHAIDPKTGDEKFAFIPKELLANPGAYLTNAKGSSNKKYGMDGQINVWTKYRTPTAADITSKTRVLEKAYLYAGMRRGGSNYYALDVSVIDAPAFKWMIKGAYNAAPTPGFEKLGLTFSAPKLADVKINDQPTKVLIFTGGYDRDHDSVGTNVAKSDNIGNALYMVHAETGQLIWRAGSTSDAGANLQIASMTNSMPADPTIVDINGDGLADIIYASDLRGQIFRFDINNANTGVGTGFATGGRIAQLGGTTAADNRRFFSSPDVALIRERGGKTYFTIAIGSGFRESPLNTDTNDRFYVLRDSNVFQKPTSYTTITEADLTNVTGFDLSAADTAAIQANIQTLEAQMRALNNAVDGARQNFIDYRAGIGHTTKQNAASQALSDANERQKQIDEILRDDPYVVENNENLQQQSKLQSSLEKAQAALAKLQQLYLDTEALAAAAEASVLADERDDADTAYNDAIDAYNIAKDTSDVADGARNTAELAKEAAADSLQLLDNLISARDLAQIAWEDDGSPLGPDHPSSIARNSAIQAVTDEESLPAGDRAARESLLLTKTSDFDDAVVAANTAASNAATKLAARDAAQAALAAANQAYDDAVLNDDNLDALELTRGQLVFEYARLTELQRDLDTAFAGIKEKEAEIIAAQANTNQIDDGLPTLQAELEALRVNYAAKAYLVRRENLNAGNPSKLDTLLATVQSALDMTGATTDVITAVNSALTALAADADIATLPVGFPYDYADLLDRAEAAKAATLRAAATNSQTIVDQIAVLLSEQAALIASGAVLQGEADALAALPYNVSSAMLSAAQLTALQAQTAPNAPTIFDAYQFLIDQALANAASPTTGLPYLRAEINKEYAKLTPGNSYTPNTSLLEASKGFYLKLPKGEKVLSDSTSFRGGVFFSTFSPRGQAVSTCGSDVGRARTYALSLIDASALFTETAADGTKTPVRSFDLKRSGIPSSPTVILSNDRPTFLTGTEVLDLECAPGVDICRAGDAVRTTYWREN